MCLINLIGFAEPLVLLLNGNQIKNITDHPRESKQIMAKYDYSKENTYVFYAISSIQLPFIDIIKGNLWVFVFFKKNLWLQFLNATDGQTSALSQLKYIHSLCSDPFWIVFRTFKHHVHSYFKAIWIIYVS